MFVYLITNTNNGKRYVGKTVGAVNDRWTKHRSDAACGKNTYLSKAIRKHGSEAFTVECIAHFDSDYLLKEAEKLFIAELRTKKPQGYNLTDGGEGCFGCTPSEETRRKISEALTGCERSAEQIAQHRLFMQGNTHCRGRRVSQHTRVAVSENNRRRAGETRVRWSEERRLKMQAVWQRRKTKDSRGDTQS